MFDKAKPTKQDLNKLAKGLAAATRLAELVANLDRAIESEIKALAVVDAAARRELSRTQLSLGVGNVYLKRLASEGAAYLAAQQAKPAPKAKAKSGTKAGRAAKKAPAKKAATKKKAVAKK